MCSGGKICVKPYDRLDVEGKKKEKNNSWLWFFFSWETKEIKFWIEEKEKGL